MANRAQWRRPFKDAGAQTVVYRRGFPYTIKIVAEAFPPKAGAILHLAPTAREILLTRPDYIDQPDNRLRECPVELAHAIAKTPQLSQIETLTLSGFGGWGDTAIRAIVASPHLTTLRRLDLTTAAPTPDSVASIFQATTLPNLDTLVLGATPQALEVAHRLTTLRVRPSRLHTLDLSDMELDDAGIAYLAGASVLAGLRTLHLGSSGLTPKSFDTLLHSDHLKNTSIEAPTQTLPAHTRRAIESRLRQHNEHCKPFQGR